MLIDRESRNTAPRLHAAAFMAYLGGVSVAGCALIGWAVHALRLSHLQAMGASFALVATLVVLAELRPLLLAGAPDSNGVTITTTFVFAILFHWGLPAAVIMQTVATLIGDRVQRRVWWRTLFNVAQYALSWGAAGLVFGVFHDAASPLHPGTLATHDLLVLLCAAAAYFIVNDVVVAEAIALRVHSSLLRAVTDDFAFQAISTGALLALSPFVVVAMERSGWLVLLLLAPLLAVYKNAAVSLEQEHASLHDPLTGLPNRKLLRQTADDALDQARRVERGVAIFLLDLDRFKEVNDTLGHEMGDRLLQYVAARLSRTVGRPCDLVARLGGDEFAVLLKDVDRHEADEVARRVLGAFDDTFSVDAMLFDLDASVGVALYPEHGTDFEALLRHADVAMYLAKGSRTGIQVYDPAQDRNSTERLALLGELRRGIEENQLELHYQPKAQLTNGSVVGLEALARWHHPERGLVPPDVFVPLAEQTGLMRSLTDFVVNAAVRQLADWRAAGIDVSVAINVSVRDLHDERFVAALREACERYGVHASDLQLEITEGTLLDDPARTEQVLHDLADLGVTMSLDDFGTGYSSLRHLKRLPVREIKIDRSFVMGMHDDPDDAAIVRSIIELGEALGLRVVAEGVETAQAWSCLAEMGCDEAQGWYLARPMPAAAVSEWLAQYADALAAPQLHAVPSSGLPA